MLRSSEGPRIRPFSQFHQITHRACSKRLQRAITDFGAEHSFADGAERLFEHYGIKISPTVVRAITLKHSQRAELFWNSLEAESLRCGPKKAPSCIISEMDGSMIPIVTTSETELESDQRKHRKTEWKEIRLCVAQVKGEVNATYAISFDAGTLHAGLELRKTVEISGCTQETFIHGLGDGAPWIAAEFERQFGTQASYLIDFYHVSEYLAKAAPHCCPEQPELWRHNQQELLKAGNAEQVLQNLQNVANPPEDVSTAIGYLQNRRHHLNYKAAIESDLPIGSGLIESGHRHVLQCRLKIPGAWWLMNSARSLATLRIIRKNRLWQQFWAA